MVSLFAFHLLDLRGGLPRVVIQSTQTIEVDSNQLQRIVLDTDGIGLEVAASSDIKRPTIQLYGSGYLNQRAVWTFDDGILTISMDPYPVTANLYGARNSEDSLTMRVLLPKKSYDEIAVSGNRLNVLIYQCRGKQLSGNIQHGSIQLEKVNFQIGTLLGMDCDMKLKRNQMSYLTMISDTGNTEMTGNRLGVCRYVGGIGSLIVETTALTGVWDLQTGSGNISVGTRKWSQQLLQNNLLLQIETQKGTVNASSTKKYWKKQIRKVLEPNRLILLEGAGTNVWKIHSESGNITLKTVKFAA